MYLTPPLPSRNEASHVSLTSPMEPLIGQTVQRMNKSMLLLLPPFHLYLALYAACSSAGKAAASVSTRGSVKAGEF